MAINTDGCGLLVGTAIGITNTKLNRRHQPRGFMLSIFAQTCESDYALIYWSKITAPDILGYHPDIMTATRMSTRVYDNGEIVLSDAFAPDALAPVGNMSIRIDYVI